MEESKSNPYQSPQGKRNVRRTSRVVFLTKQRLIWIGVALIFLGLAAFTISHALFVRTIGQYEELQVISVYIDVFGLFSIVAGAAALIMSGWRREPATSFRYGGQSKHSGDSNSTSNE